jgi:hypothetical protein
VIFERVAGNVKHYILKTLLFLLMYMSVYCLFRTLSESYECVAWNVRVAGEPRIPRNLEGKSIHPGIYFEKPRNITTILSQYSQCSERSFEQASPRIKL